MAAFVLQPYVTEFVDVVMHDRGIEFRLEEIPVHQGSPIEGAFHDESAARDGCPRRPGHHRDRHTR
jgi:voltage-gated potassium channel